jgi:DNA-binding transcriptional LysR family regulator
MALQTELTLTAMRVVREVAARGSFTAAARALGYTQSAVSRQVAVAEQAVGAPLFERLPRGVRPTASGAILARHAIAVLERVAAAELELGTIDDALAGRLVLGAFPTALAVLVPRALAQLRAQHSGVAVTLREGGTIAQLRRVRAGRVAVAVIAAGGGLEYDLDDLETDALLLGEPRLAVSEDHPFAARPWVNVAELESETWIVGTAGADGPQFGPWPSLQTEAAIGHALRDWPGRLGLVAAGLGVALIPSLLAGALPPGVRALRVEDPRPLRREVLAVTRPERAPATQALIDALHAAAGELAPGD